MQGASPIYEVRAQSLTRLPSLPPPFEPRVWILTSYSATKHNGISQSNICSKRQQAPTWSDISVPGRSTSAGSWLPVNINTLTGHFCAPTKHGSVRHIRHVAIQTRSALHCTSKHSGSGSLTAFPTQCQSRRAVVLGGSVVPAAFFHLLLSDVT